MFNVGVSDPDKKYAFAPDTIAPFSNLNNVLDYYNSSMWSVSSNTQKYTYYTYPGGS